MYVDEKRLISLADQVNVAFKALELEVAEMKADIAKLKTEKKVTKKA